MKTTKFIPLIMVLIHSTIAFGEIEMDDLSRKHANTYHHNAIITNILAQKDITRYVALWSDTNILQTRYGDDWTKREKYGKSEKTWKKKRMNYIIFIVITYCCKSALRM